MQAVRRISIPKHCDLKNDGTVQDGLLQASSVIQQRAREAYKLFKQNPFHPSLRFKRVHQPEPVFSVRVTLDYRAVGVREGDTIVWFWIGPHAEYERLLSAL